MKFSVLMSVYYRENPLFLKQALASVYNNSFPPTEVVLVEDGLLNNELYSVIEDYKSTHNLKVVKIKNNVGLGNALNEGIRVCAHEIIARMDTDDICDHFRFEKQIAFIKKNPNVVLIGGGVEEYDETLTYYLGKRDAPCDLESIIKTSLTRNPFNHMSVMFVKSKVQLIGGYKHHLYMEDYNLWLRMLASGKYVANLPDTLVRVRAGDSMLKRRKGFFYIKSEFQLMKLKIKLHLDKPLHAFFIFLARSMIRLSPQLILKEIYKKLRK